MIFTFFVILSQIFFFFIDVYNLLFLLIALKVLVIDHNDRNLLNFIINSCKVLKENRFKSVY